MADKSETQRQIEENRRLLQKEMDERAQELARQEQRAREDEWRN